MCGGRGRAPRATYNALPYAPTYHLSRASPRQPGARGPPTRRQPPPAAARARGRSFSAGGAIVPAAHGSPRVCIPPDAAAHTLYSAVAVCRAAAARRHIQPRPTMRAAPLCPCGSDGCVRVQSPRPHPDAAHGMERIFLQSSLNACQEAFLLGISCCTGRAAELAPYAMPSLELPPMPVSGVRAR